jgi:transcriptional regulator with XRE-family HTH domain
MYQEFTWLELGHRIRDRRLELRFTQQRLAKLAGMTQAGLARIESGKTNPQLKTLDQLATAMSSTVRYLLTGFIESTNAHPVIHSFFRVLQSGDQAAIDTVVHAVKIAETLLERRSRISEISPSGISAGRDGDTIEIGGIKQK